jgi:predicted nucleic acid-binding protein
MGADEAVVCDASVLAAMIFGEPGSAEARSLTRFRRLLAPTLLRYEMAHIAVRKVALAPDEAPRIQKAFAASLRVPMRLVEPSWPTVVELARANGLSAYDASYLQVALALRVRVVTLDRRLARAAEDLGIMAGSRVE